MTIPTPPSAPAEDAALQTPRPRGWWRRNGIALAVIAVVAPALAGFLWWDGWNAFYGHGARPVAAIAADAGGTVRMSGTTFGPIQTGIAKDTSGMNLPDGTTFHIAIVDVDPQEPITPEGTDPADVRFVSCTAPVLVQQSTGRQWTPLRAEVGVPYSSDEPETCNSQAEGPYKLVVGFVVPDDVEGPFWLDVDPAGDGRFIRFSVES
ncbi:tetratricopeptide repeat protein [Microbacterium sp. H1-D42]|uniref:tetratricopeptide repeat protein n=1 Tax=Microbacterium sp. H1-D42 TaxID=2925844 RepID=UPI001F535921|nr:tetratricopeptide repeat protein [Microbacterium sp. H1-D42]UNK71324.1 tetratricopeptide repeat protein [Microbacterium sp. H1-D42]